MPESMAIVDPDGRFLGFGAPCEHRTVGPHRAWCLDCREWCYPSIPCLRCEEHIGRGSDDA